jgi:hypothetical protein
MIADPPFLLNRSDMIDLADGLNKLADITVVLGSSSGISTVPHLIQAAFDITSKMGRKASDFSNYLIRVTSQSMG